MRVGKRVEDIKEHLWTTDDIRGMFQPEFLGVNNTDTLLPRLMLTPFSVHDPDFLRHIDETRQCFRCRTVVGRGEFPARHVCGRCTAVVYCSRRCQAQDWLDGHRAECRCSREYKTSHRCLEMALKIVSRLSNTGELHLHMSRHGCRKRLLVLARGRNGHVMVFPVKLDFVSCLPLTDEGKQFLRDAVTSTRALRILIGVLGEGGVTFMSSGV